jgi:hypothetical protein
MIKQACLIPSATLLCTWVRTNGTETFDIDAHFFKFAGEQLSRPTLYQG